MYLLEWVSNWLSKITKKIKKIKGRRNSSNLEAKVVKEKIIQSEMYNHGLFNTI